MLELLSSKFTDITRKFSNRAIINEKNIEEAVEEIKEALIDADVNLRVIRRFINQVAEEAKGESVLRSVDPKQQFIKIVNDKIVALLGDKHEELKLKGRDTLSPILLLGLQGSGKTTTASKLALKLKNEGRKTLLVAADLVRPAAAEQLFQLGSQVGVEVYRESTKSPLKVALNGIKYAEKNQFDSVIIDTTGRLEADSEMIDEISKIKKRINPVETLLVADAMTGQAAVNIASTFDEAVDLTGVIFTKFDSDTRGGAVFSLKSITGKPVKYIGTGEKSEALEPFHPDRMASRILGMGDVVTLVEKAQQVVTEEEAEKLQKKFAGGTFTLEDYLKQMQQMKKMGDMGSLMEMIPGMRSKMDNIPDISEYTFKKEEAIILSMTQRERQNHRVIGPPRKRRIALGSGTTVVDVNKLLKDFEKFRITLKKLNNNRGKEARLLKQAMGSL